MEQDIAERFAQRDRMRRNLDWRKTPAERLRAMGELEEAAWEVLRRSPEGYAHFLRRNYKVRAIDVPEGGFR